MTAPIRLEINPSAAEIILERPSRRNALTLSMWQALPGLVTEATADPGVSVLLLHGGDTGAFAAGADISEFAETYATPASAARAADIIAAALAALETCPKPVIAAIEGACVGGGVSLAMAADLRIAGAGSRFAITPGKLGLVYAASDTRRLITAIGVGAAKDILFTGRSFGAAEAGAMGLVDRLCAEGEALAEARRLAGEIASVSQWSVRATKAMIRGLQSGWSEADGPARDLFLAGFRNDDFLEGYTAFLEKRPARFPQA